jgi:Rap1a immunity proteins
MLRNLLIAALLVACLIAPAYADTELYTVQGLLSECNKSRPTSLVDVIGHGRCVGYFEALFDLASQFNVCPPENVTRDQMSAVFIAWAQRNPQKWNEYRLDGSIAAFQEA